jgi:hypothetical protein
MMVDCSWFDEMVVTYMMVDVYTTAFERIWL